MQRLLSLTHTFWQSLSGRTTATARRNSLRQASLSILGLLLAGFAFSQFLLPLTASSMMTDRYIATTGTDAGNCSNMASPCATLAYAISQSASGDTINAAAGTYVLSATVNVNVANLTIKGASSATTIFQVAQAVGNAFSINAAGVTLTDLQIQKTDVTGVHELILVNATGDNFTLQNSLIQGPDPGTPWSVNGIVSRALVSATGGVTGLLIQNNTIKYLRQPAYFNPGTVGTVSNNNVSGTRGWVVDGGTINFTGNSWGPPVNQGADIALLSSCNPADYPNLVALSNANSNAFISAQFVSAPAAPFNGRATAFVDDSAAPGGDGSSGLPYQTIAAGNGGALFGGTVNVAAGTYTELVNANRSLTFTGVGTPMVMAPAGSNQTIFTIAAANVTIQGFKITVNRPSAAAGIAAIDPASFSGAQILNNTIQSTGTGSTFSTPVGNTSAAGIALLGNGGAIESVTIKGNTINSGDATNFFSRAIWLREVQATVGGATAPEGNTLVATTQDLLNQFASGGTTLVQNNTFNGAGIDFTEPNNSPSTINIQNNQFAPGSPLFSQSCLIKHNYLNVPVNIANNTFTGHTTGIWSGGSQNVTISGNSFTPATGLASYQNIRVDTAWPGTQVAPFNSNSVAINGNTFNGAAGSTGAGISFRNGQRTNTADPDFSSVVVGGNTFNANLTEFMRLDATATQQFENNIDATTNLFDVGSGAQLPSAMFAMQLAALENKVFHKLDNPIVGLVTFVANTIFVSSTGISGSTPTATDNDYTRVNNAVQAAPSGTTIKLNGPFNWVETNAAASWAAGSDGNAGTTADNYSIYVPANRNNITFTANALGDATIEGPGDLPAVDLESVLYFDGGDNQNWTISNLRFLEFDNVIGMFGGAGGVDAFNGTKILNNYIHLATDLDSAVAPNDTAQNIAIHLAYGTNQLISGNTIEINGNGVRTNDAADVALQSNTSGGNVYDGLQITNNFIRVLQAQSANPEVVIGIWENAHGHSSNITISGNQFLNLASGNNPATNLQRAFRITSHSSATSTVKYENNTVRGANIGFQWRFGPFTGNQPVQLISNTITGNNTGVDVAEDGVAVLKFNRIVGNLAAGVAGNSATQILAENNWWGCNFGPGATGAGCSGATNGAANSGSGGIDANPWLVLEHTASPTTVVSGSTANLTASLKKNSVGADTSLMGMGTIPNGTPVSFAGTLGTVAPVNTTTSGALATSIYTATGVGVGNTSSTVDGQTAAQSITITGALAFVQQPTITPPSTAITPAVTVQLKNGANNNIAQAGVPISIALTSGTGTLSGTLTQTTNAAGLATFNNLSIDLPGVKQLTASGTNLTPAVSNNFTILEPCVLTCPTDLTVGTTGTSSVVNYPTPTTTGACGTVTCSPASGSSFPLGTTTVTCNSSIGARTCSFRVTVERVSFNVTDPLACSGPGNTVTGTFSLTNNGNASVSANATVTLPAGLVGVPGSGITNVGTVSVTNTAVNFQATLSAGQTATVSYSAQIGDQVAAGTVLCSNLSATFDGGPAYTVPACLTVNCPSPNPGTLPPATAEAADQKPGSVLIYNVYTSSATNTNTQNTRINITNTNTALPSFVHLFFVADSCSIADSYLCLTANQTASFQVSDLDPGTTGYLVAVAVNSMGCPVDFNYLIGDEYVKFATGHAANLGAVAFAALAGGLPTCDSTSVTATLNFDGVSYNRVPRTLAASNIGARADGNDALLVLNRIGGNLGIGAATLGTIFGIFYDDAENGVSFSLTGGCQLRGSINNNFPRLTPRFDNFVPAGRTGWFKLFSQSDVGITGAILNTNANTAASAGAFNQGHNLHALTLSAGQSYLIPVFPPGC